MVDFFAFLRCFKFRIMEAKIIIVAFFGLFSTFTTFTTGVGPFESMYVEEAEEGDLSAICPTVLISILVRNKQHTLPYFFGQLENLDYPKRRIHLLIRTDHNLDRSRELVEEWVGKVGQLYGNVDFESAQGETFYGDETNPFDWTEERFLRLISLKEESFLLARKKLLDFVFFLDADQFLTNSRTLQILMGQRKTVVAPMLRDRYSNYSNFWAALDENGYFLRSKVYYEILFGEQRGAIEVPMVHSAILVDLRSKESAHLTFDPANLRFYTGPVDDMLVFAESAARDDIPLHIVNSDKFGYLLAPIEAESGVGLEHDERSMRALVSDLIADANPPGLLYSPYLAPKLPRPSKLGLDKIFLINLERRPFRRRRMEWMFRLHGIDYDWLRAVDGQRLAGIFENSSKSGIFLEEANDPSSFSVRMLPNYADPHSNRPLTLGEVGCFLSHYRIWRRVLAENLSRVLVFEDDLRFDFHWDVVFDRMQQDIGRSNLEFDLIYLGRKRLNSHREEPVEGQRYLTRVSYTYWTLAYVLSNSGARKLLEAKPLDKLVAVDEFLPIMFDRHPNETWKSHFAERKLRAFTVEPLIIHPSHYTDEPGYISDTEWSETIPLDELGPDTKLGTVFEGNTAKDEL